MLKALLTALLLASPWAASAAVLGFPGEEAACVGIYIKDLRNGSIVAAENAEMAMVPASTLKTLTTASALRLLGPEFRFTTEVRLTGSRDGFTWYGDLEVCASADPSLESAEFESNLGFCDSIVARLGAMNIQRVAGRIRVKAPMQDAGPSPKWEIEDVAWSYGASLYGFNWRDNIFRLWPATGRTKPHIPDLKITLRHSPDGNDLLRGVGSNNLEVWGRNTGNRKWSITSTMPDPQAVFVHELKERLSAAGIKVLGRDIKPSAAGTTSVYTHRSPRAAVIMRSLMVRSDNMMADGMLRAVEPDGTRADALRKEKALWDSLGVSLRYSAVLDGCGLARANRISPVALGRVLETMASGEYSADYIGFFPRAGIDGTLKNFMAKTPLRGRLALKTGSVSAVQCYAGYLLDDEGQRPTHVVVLMVNAFYCPRATLREKISDYLIEKLTEKQ